jgi:ankyrin repeat protein
VLLLPALIVTAVLLAAAPILAAGSDDRDLFEAIVAQDVARAERAIGRGADPNGARNAQGESPLMAAAAAGNLEMVKALVAAGAEINLPVSTGLSHTNALARSVGSIKVLMYLIERGGTVKGDGKVEPLIIEAARAGSAMAARYLLIRGADPNEAGAGGWTALMTAVTCCQNDRGNLEMVRLLLEWKSVVDRADDQGVTPLMRTTDPRIATLLIDKGADVHALDARGNNALNAAVGSASMKEAEIVAVARILLASGADPNLPGADRRTPLVTAIWQGHGSVVNLLLDNGADIDGRDPAGITPLMVAAQSHQEPMLRLLVARKADVNAADRFGATPLMHLVEGLTCASLEESVRPQIELLLEAGADPTIKNTDGQSLADTLSERRCSGELVALLAKAPVRASQPPQLPPPDQAPAVPRVPSPTPPPAPNAPTIAAPLPRGVEDSGRPPGPPVIVPVPPPASAPSAAVPKPALGRQSRKVDQLAFNDRRFFLAMSKRDYPGMDEALSRGVEINLQNENLPEGTFLLHAVRSRDLKLAAYLLSKRADPNLRDLGGQTPLALAVGDRTMMKLLFGRGSELDALSEGESVDETPLAKAVRMGDLESAKLLLSLGADVNRRDSTGVPPLMIALPNPDRTMLTMLVENGADVNAEVPGEWTTPLMNAVVANDLGTVEFLLERGADVNGKNVRGYNPLLLAVELAGRPIIQKLLDAGADVNLAGYGGTTPLIESVMLNRGEAIVRLLLEKGADVNASDDNGVTPLIIAIIRGQADVVATLLDLKADPRRADRQGKPPLQYALEAGETGAGIVTLLKAGGAGNLPGAGSGTAKPVQRPEQRLVAAVRSGDLATAGELLTAGLRVTTRDEETRRPLIALAVASGKREMVDLLLARGADLNDAGGASTLHVAVEAGSLEMVAFLLDKGARVNALAEDGGSPLHTAIRLGCVAELGAMIDPAKRTQVTRYVEIARKLIDAGADPNAGTLQVVDLGDDSLWNPLHLAAYLGSPAMVELLLRMGTVDSRTAAGNTPLHLAVLTLSGTSLIEVVDLLLGRGADPNAKNVKGNSVLAEALFWWDSWPGWGEVVIDDVPRPRWLILVEHLLDGGALPSEPGEYHVYPLHGAAESGFTQLASLLLDRGAPINAIDRDGSTPLLVAVRSGRTEIVDLLVKRHAGLNTRNRDGETPLDEARRMKKNGVPEAAEIERLLLAAGAEPGSTR